MARLCCITFWAYEALGELELGQLALWRMPAAAVGVASGARGSFAANKR